MTSQLLDKAPEFFSEAFEERVLWSIGGGVGGERITSRKPKPLPAGCDEFFVVYLTEQDAQEALALYSSPGMRVGRVVLDEALKYVESFNAFLLICDGQHRIIDFYDRRTS